MFTANKAFINQHGTLSDKQPAPLHLLIIKKKNRGKLVELRILANKFHHLNMIDFTHYKDVSFARGGAGG